MNKSMMKNVSSKQVTGNLDSTYGEEAMEDLSKLNDAGTTIIMVTHSPTYAEHGNWVLHLFDGHIVTENMKGKFHV